MDRGRAGWASELCAVHTLAVDRLVAASLAVGNKSSVWTACFSDGGLLGELLRDFVGVVFVDAGGEEEVLSSLYIGGVVVVLTRVGSLVFEDLNELVEAGSNNSTEDGSKPVDPVVAVERAVDNRGTK